MSLLHYASVSIHVLAVVPWRGGMFVLAHVDMELALLLILAATRLTRSR